MPAGRRTSDFAACSSKFMSAPSAAVLGPIGAEHLFLRGLVLRDRSHEVRDVDKVAVIQVLVDAVAAPGAAAHAEREVQPVVETAAVTEGVRLVDENAHDVGLFGELAPA